MRAPWANAPRWWNAPLLWGAEQGYALGVAAHRALYSLRLRRRHRLPIPVICVGNITVGGTGKTPAVIALCRRLIEWGERPAVLSRGYRGEKERDEIIAVDPQTSDWQTVGDEPLLIARALEGVSVFVGADRVATAHRALAEASPTVIVLDDGFQHWRLARDLDIVLLDGTAPVGNGHLLPRGPLREPVAALRRAGAVVLTKINLAEEAGLWAQRLERRLAAPVIQAAHRPVRFVDLGDGTAHPVDAIRDQRVIAISGLANNMTFPALLGSLGAVIEGALGFEDHQNYGPDEWATIRRVVAESDAARVITTAKDAVKWREADIGDLPVWVLEIDFEPCVGAERLWRTVRQTLDR